MANKKDDLAAELRTVTQRGLAMAGGWLLLTVVLLVVGLARWSVAAAAVVALGVSVALMVFYWFQVVVPQRRVAAQIIELARRGDAADLALLGMLHRLCLGDLVIPERLIRELSDSLTRGIHQATSGLASQIQRIQDRSLEIAVVGGEVQATSVDLASGFSQQSAAVVEITATIEELARTAAQISQNAEHQAALAEEAENEGNKGAESVESVVSGIDGLSERINGIAQRADSLGSRSKEIYQILDLINEIAHDTHILSLNAAIEAETAGEHGRRFAVVAEEVRRLAQRARESVQSVRVHLEEFSGAIRSTVVATEEGSKEASHVIHQARQAQDSIEQLRRALSDTSIAAQEISLATKEQRTASDQVATTIKEVREVIQRMADGLRNFSGTARNLNDLALAIQLVTQGFRFDSPRSLKHEFHNRGNALAQRGKGFEGVQGELREILRSAPYLEFCYVVDVEGTMLACAISKEWSDDGRLPSEVEVGKNYSERLWFKTVQQTGSATITPLYESLLTSEQCFTVAAPLLTEDGRSLGVLGADVNLTSWIKI